MQVTLCSWLLEICCGKATQTLKTGVDCNFRVVIFQKIDLDFAEILPLGVVRVGTFEQDGRF